MRERTPMICLLCGATMNHHADKAIPAAADATSIEVIEELHACPRCGAAASRPAADS
jgi:hypothetical protein